MDEPGLSFNKTAETLRDFLEIAFHTLLCLRGIYDPTSFTRVKAYGVPVYQSRVPDVRAYIAGVVAAIESELKAGHLRSVGFIVRTISTGEALEQYLFETRYMDLSRLHGEQDKDKILAGAPKLFELTTMLQTFVTRLMALDGQLTDFADDQERTFAVLIRLVDGAEPDTRPVLDFNSYDGDRMARDRDPQYHPPEGASPWTPALRSDLPGNAGPSDGYHGKGKGRALDDMPGGANKSPDRGQPFIAVRSVETGVIDVNLMVQECAAKQRFASSAQRDVG